MLKNFINILSSKSNFMTKHKTRPYGFRLGKPHEIRNSLGLYTL